MPKETKRQMEADRKERASWREYLADKEAEKSRKPQTKQQARGRL